MLTTDRVPLGLLFNGQETQITQDPCDNPLVTTTSEAEVQFFFLFSLRKKQITTHYSTVIT
jgi:hypothetical protein